MLLTMHQKRFIAMTVQSFVVWNLVFHCSSKKIFKDIDYVTMSPYIAHTTCDCHNTKQKLKCLVVNRNYILTLEAESREDQC